RARMDTRTAVQHIAQALCELVVRVAEPVGLAAVGGIGVSSAGPLDLAAGAVSPVNIPELRGVPFLHSLAGLVPGRPTRLTGDGRGDGARGGGARRGRVRAGRLRARGPGARRDDRGLRGHLRPAPGGGRRRGGPGRRATHGSTADVAGGARGTAVHGGDRGGT